MRFRVILVAVYSMKPKATYFEIDRWWPEHYASVVIQKKLCSRVSHLDIYKGTADARFLDNFIMTEFSPGHIADMLPNNCGWPIVSPACSKEFVGVDAEVKATLHAIKPMLIPSCPPELEGFSLLSASLVLDCLDTTSDLIRWFDDTRTLVSSYKKLCLLRDKIPEGVSFFAVERVPCVHVISGKLRTALHYSAPEGMIFRPCELI